MKGVRRSALVFAILSAVYWNGVASFLAMIFPLAGADVAPFWMVGLSGFVPSAIYAVATLYFCHWLTRRVIRQAESRLPE